MKIKFIEAIERTVKEMVDAIKSELSPHPVADQAVTNLQAAVNSLKLHPQAQPVQPSGVVSPGKGDDADDAASAPVVTAADHGAATDASLAKNAPAPAAPATTTVQTSGPATIETDEPVTMQPPAATK